jgi:enoyl-CoA hydratase/carnithine racemase
VSEAPTVRLRLEAPIARVTLARPPARNALNLAMCRELRDAFDRIEKDDNVRIVLLDAEGPVFCAGADLKERAGKDEQWVRERRKAAYAAYDAIVRCSRPVVAVLQGPVVGSGGEIAMSCDFAIASEAANFRFPEPQWGTVGATQRLQRVIGKRRAKELLFTGRVMPVQEAYSLGLVARVTTLAELPKLAEEIAQSIAAAPGLAMILTKQAVDRGEETSLSEGLEIEFEAVERCLADKNWKAGIDRFSRTIGRKGRD